MRMIILAFAAAALAGGLTVWVVLDWPTIRQALRAKGYRPRHARPTIGRRLVGAVTR